MKIYKYPLAIADRQVIKANIIKPLTVQNQGGVPCLWALVDNNIAERNVAIAIVGTGHETNISPDNYIGTTQNNGFVWHWFIDTTD